MSYEVYQTDSFAKKFKKLDRAVKKEFDKTIKKLAMNPYSGAGNVGHLHGEFKGLRRIRVGRGWRMYFSICEECRSLGYVRLRGCIDCNEKQDRSIVLFDIIHK